MIIIKTIILNSYNKVIMIIIVVRVRVIPCIQCVRFTVLCKAKMDRF